MVLPIYAYVLEMCSYSKKGRSSLVIEAETEREAEEKRTRGRDRGGRS